MNEEKPPLVCTIDGKYVYEVKFVDRFDGVVMRAAYLHGEAMGGHVEGVPLEVSFVYEATLWKVKVTPHHVWSFDCSDWVEISPDGREIDYNKVKKVYGKVVFEIT